MMQTGPGGGKFTRASSALGGPVSWQRHPRSRRTARAAGRPRDMEPLELCHVVETVLWRLLVSTSQLMLA
ncbi:hypothetical protein SORBI_3003G421600 [Sorghum bicolor]|uniref:Uncharacterized protein n=1 Tax=Sorghum bicolor TaxID=4558 RepID=C5XHR4_SORBI|nr:hypothetical protein SORBI_3003G421600 [Sorghum bicolor]